DALVFLLRLKQGLQNGTASSLMSEYVKWFWTDDLKHHFDQEETLLLPVLNEEDEMAARLKKEHQTIRSLVSKKLNEMEIALLSELLNSHIRFEERELFPHIEQRATAEELNEIFKQLDHPTQCQTGW